MKPFTISEHFRSFNTSHTEISPDINKSNLYKIIRENLATPEIYAHNSFS